MLDQKLSNPFLKQSPFANSNLPRTSYALPTYSNVTSYASPNKFNYQYPKSSLPLTSQTYQPRISQTGDIGSILSKNPFTRPNTSIFNASRANNDISPSNYELNRLNPRTSYQHISQPAIYSKPYIPTHENGTYQNQKSQARLTPSRRQDNYLSTSSTDSAATYINKIYDLDQDKNFDNMSVNNLSNPFLRKNLLQQKYEVKIPNSYENAGKRSIAPQVNYQFDKQTTQYNNYISSDFGIKQAVRNPYSYQSKYEDFKKSEPKPDNRHMKYQFKQYIDQPALGNNYSLKSKGRLYENQYQSQYPNRKQTNNYASKMDYSNHNLNYQPKRAYQLENKYRHEGNEDHYNYANTQNDYKYDKQHLYKEYEDPSFRNKNQRNQKEPNFNYLQKEKEPNYQTDEYDYNGKYSYQPQQHPELSNKFKQGYKLPEMTKFQQQSSMSQSLKYKSKSYNQYPEAFETLGNQPVKLKDNPFNKNYNLSKKIITSQVEQYKEPKVHEDTRQKFKEQKGKSNSLKNILPKLENEQDCRQYKPAVRDGEGLDGFPKILELRGVVFHQVQLK